MKVSYCTTCHGRLWQIALTLLDNLNRLKSDEEVVLVDYGSRDGLKRFVESSIPCQDAIQERKLVYAYVDAWTYHCPKAKNLAHRLGRGDFLVNLDADNSNEGMRDVIDKVFKVTCKPIVLHMDNELHNGAYGRICLPRDWFYRLGGYDEDFLPSAYQDTDIIERAKAMGLSYVLMTSSVSAPIKNTTPEKALHTGKQGWWEMKKANKQKSEANIQKGKIIANRIGWGNATVSINFKANLRLAPLSPVLSVVIYSRLKTETLNRVVDSYRKISWIDEIIVINDNTDRTIALSGDKVTTINATDSLGPNFQMTIAALAACSAVLLIDDNVCLSEKALREIHITWSIDPQARCMFAVSESESKAMLVADTASEYKRGHIRALVTTPAECSRSLARLDAINGALTKPDSDGARWDAMRIEGLGISLISIPLSKAPLKKGEKKGRSKTLANKRASKHRLIIANGKILSSAWKLLGDGS